MKFKVSWWIHGAGRICRGHDILDVSEDFDEDDAEELIEKDLRRNLSSSLTKYDFPSPFEPNLPNFHKKHSDLTLESRHSEISNFGVLRVMPLKEMKK